MFEGQPKGLWALALANTGERFGYYTMLAVFYCICRPTSVSHQVLQVVFIQPFSCWSTSFLL